MAPGTELVGKAPPWRAVVRRPQRLFTLAGVLWWLAVVEIGVRVAPLDRLAARVGAPLAAGAGVSDTVSLAVTRQEAQRLRVLQRVMPRWPFCEGPCLRQALVAGRILRRHHPRLRLGVAVEGSGVVAHAWLEVADTTIGYDGAFLPLSADDVGSPAR